MDTFRRAMQAPWKLMAVALFLTFFNQCATFSDDVTYACSSDFVHLPFCNRNSSVADRVYDLLSRLSLEEKIEQLVSSAANISRLGIPSYYWWSEALHGLSDDGPGVRFGGEIPGVTVFPQVILSAASFNRSLWNLIAQAVSTEARAMYNLGQAGLTYWSPNINIFRDPRWGRGQETPGEDPFLSSEYAVAYVSGLQGQDYNEDSKHLIESKGETQNALKVAACCKHFTAYDLEAWGGYTRYTFNALVTPQDLGDTYHPPFKSCVQDAQAKCVMCSYNRLNGLPTCADGQLLSQLVRQQWGLEGYITSDCDAVAVVYEYIGFAASPEDAVAMCLNAGMDLNCGTYVSRHAAAAIQSGSLNVSTIERALFNLFSLRMQLGLFDGDPKFQPFGKLGSDSVCSDSHRKLAFEAAKQGLVLLKNDAKNLPFSTDDIKKIAVIGPNANASADILLGNYAGPPCDFVTPLEALQEYAIVTYARGCVDVECVSDSLIDAAIEVAAVADAVIIIVGLDKSQEREDHDRTILVLPGVQEKLVSETSSAANGSVVLVILSGGPVDVTFARDNSKIGSIIWAGYPGEAGGKAIAELIFGGFSPGGKLPMTWYPETFTQVPMTDMNMRPNISSGYPGRTHRFYTGDTVFKFGHGLSYMDVSETFAFAPSEIILPICMDLSGEKILMMDPSPSQCHVPDEGMENDVKNRVEFNVTVRLRISGSMGGSYTVLLFSRPSIQYMNIPQQQLVGFKRVDMEPQSTVDVGFVVNPYKHMTVATEYGNMVLHLGPYVLAINDQVHHTVILKFA
ncbi:hypothetical protein KP509_35G006700 [Ceratopteris richardii]|uniref:Fibronectin type III-like domain-containing protein n=1 Tax=Ceratopteris richardii TaxID=49495 RepID=A0A8T2QE53_CERRI|nr:hypothetical protein KP509_35G006700 [Ceratopteris richardii]